MPDHNKKNNRKLTEDQHKADEHGLASCDSIFLNAAFEFIDEAIISANPEAIILSWNPAAQNMFGFTAKEAIGRSVADLIIPDERKKEFSNILERVKHGELIKHFETKRKQKSGDLVPVFATVLPIINEQSQFIGVTAIYQDITREQRTTQYTRSLIEASPDPLVTISPEGKITDVNEATIKVTGLSRNKLIGTDFSDYFTEPEKARQGYQQVFERGIVTNYPLTIRSAKNGDRRTTTDVLYNASVYKNKDGKVLGVFAAARDVTALKAAEAAQMRRTEELEKLNKFMIGRELKMIELKQENAELRKKAGLYPSS